MPVSNLPYFEIVDHILTTLGFPPDFRFLFTYDTSFLGLFACLICIILCIYCFTRYTKSHIPKLDHLTHWGLSSVAFFSLFTFWVNIFAHLFSLTVASLVTWFLCFAIPIYFKKANLKEVKAYPKTDLTWMVAIWLWSTFIITVVCGIDFGKFHMALSESIIQSQLLPGMKGFPMPNDIPYHYGANLLAASFTDLFHINLIHAEDILPLFMAPVPFLAFRWLSSHFFNCEKMVTRIALLAHFGTSLRIFLCLFLFLIYIISGKIIFDPDQFEIIRLFTREFDLNISTALTQMEHLLHPSSQLGLPILLMCFCIWLHKNHDFSLNSKIAISLIILSGQSHFREDYLMLSLLGLFLMMLKEKYYRNKLFWVSFTLLFVFACSLGGVFTQVLKNKLIENKEVATSSTIHEATQNNDVNSSNLYDNSISVVPKMGTLSINRGRTKVPLYHPQLMLDLCFDYGIALLGIIFVPIFLIKHKEKGLYYYTIPLFLSLVVILFFDNDVITYKLDIQRLVSYNLFCWFLCVAFFSIYPKFLTKLVLIICLISPIIAGFSLPARLTKECWNWYHFDWIEIGNYLKTQPYDHNAIILGINPCFTGRKSFAFQEDFAFFWKAKQEPQKMRKIYEAIDIEKMRDYNVKYVVYPKNLSSSISLPKAFVAKEYICYKIDRQP